MKFQPILILNTNNKFSTFRLKLNSEFLNVENIKLCRDEISSMIDINVICFVDILPELIITFK